MILRLLPLVLGAFAIGSETFMLSGVLPAIAADLHTSPAAAGSLVTIFALSYAIGAPLVAIATANVERKRLLMAAIGAFALSNLLASLAPSLSLLAVARVLLALTAGAYMPAAIAFATALHGPAERGRAVALVYAGMTLATVIGVPGGTYIAHFASWRASFVAVALVAGVALIGVAALLPRLQGARAVGLAERFAVAARPEVLKLLALTTLALIGPFAANTYLGVLVETTLGIGGDRLSLILMIFGIVGFFGSQFGGYAADHWPREKSIATILAVLISSFALIALGGEIGGAAGASTLIGGLSLWGLFGWAFPIVQQARLVSLDPALAQITLSLNNSALYFGAALGASLGGFVVAESPVANVGWAAAASEVAALALLVATSRLVVRRPAPAPAVLADAGQGC